MENPKEETYNRLYSCIMNLEIKPGMIISENQLAQQLSISRTPIREILKRLENQKLVEIIPQIGTRVTFIDKSLIDEVLFMRFVLEKEVIKLLQTQISQDEIKELSNNISLQEFYIEKKMIVEFHNTDTAFHELLFEMAGKSRVWETIISVGAHYDRVRLLYLFGEENLNSNEIILDHREILDCIVKKKPYECIENVLIKHVYEPMEKWSAMFEKNGFKDYFLNGII